MESFYPVMLYALLGATGGVAWWLVAKYGWAERYELLRRIALGAIVGFTVFFSDQSGSLSALELAFTRGIVAVEIISAYLNRRNPNQPIPLNT